MARRTSTEVAKNSPGGEKPNYKLRDRLEEAKQCVIRAKTCLGNSRNIKTEIKTEVTTVIERLYQLVKEGENVKGRIQTKELVNEEKPEKEKEVTKKIGEEERELIEKMRQHATLIQENNQKMEKLKETIERHQEQQEKLSYASVAAVLPRKPEQTALHSIVVTAADDTKTGEEVLDRIRKVVNAKESGIEVERIRKAKDRKIIVGCRTDEERQKLKERLKGANELKVEEMKNKDPLVILKDVFKFNSDEDVLDALKNPRKGVPKELTGQKMEIAFKKQTRNPHTHHIVLRVSPKIWQHLVNTGSVQVDLQRVRVADQSPLVQCSLCLGYGHGKRFCKESIEKCCHCGGPHMKSECESWLADAPPSCPNCTHAKLDRVDHNAFSNECPIRRKWEALARATIAYC